MPHLESKWHLGPKNERTHLSPQRGQDSCQELAMWLRPTLDSQPHPVWTVNKPRNAPTHSSAGGRIQELWHALGRERESPGKSEGLLFFPFSNSLPLHESEVSIKLFYRSFSCSLLHTSIWGGEMYLWFSLNIIRLIYWWTPRGIVAWCRNYINVMNIQKVKLLSYPQGMPVLGPSVSGTLVDPGHRGANKDRGWESLSERDAGLHCI